MFQLGALGGKLLRDALYHTGNQPISLLHSSPRLVDKADLRLVPARTKLVEFVVGEELSRPIVLQLLFWHEIASPLYRTSGGSPSWSSSRSRRVTSRLHLVARIAIHLD